MSTSKRFAGFLISVMLLPLLLSACASNSPPPSESPTVAPRTIPPLIEAARQSPPSEPYLERVRRNIEKWAEQLQSISQPDSSAKPATTR